MKRSTTTLSGNTKKVKEYWEEQARVFKASELATSPDHYYRQFEIEKILSYVPRGLRPHGKKIAILDVGCGNGYSTFRFAKERPGASIVGIDYSETMIEHANKTLQKARGLSKRISFSVGNTLTLSTTPMLKEKKFDYIISERCLINLADWREQRNALLEMKKLLKPGGRIILAENTQEGLARLNILRKSLDLQAIKVRWHNYYMPEKKLLPFLKKEFRLEATENIGNLYYIISRVVYASLAEREGKEPEYTNHINEIASRLPSLGAYTFSPNFIFLLRKK